MQNELKNFFYNIIRWSCAFNCCYWWKRKTMATNNWESREDFGILA